MTMSSDTRETTMESNEYTSEFWEKVFTKYWDRILEWMDTHVYENSNSNQLQVDSMEKKVI